MWYKDQLKSYLPHMTPLYVGTTLTNKWYFGFSSFTVKRKKKTYFQTNAHRHVSPFEVAMIASNRNCWHYFGAIFSNWFCHICNEYHLSLWRIQLVFIICKKIHCGLAMDTKGLFAWIFTKPKWGHTNKICPPIGLYLKVGTSIFITKTITSY